MQLIKLMRLIEFVVITTMESKVNEDRRAFTALLSYVRLNFSEKGSFLEVLLHFAKSTDLKQIYEVRFRK